MKTNLQLYCKYLMSSNDNYTATNLSEHYYGLSHDSVTRFLKGQRLTLSLLWEKVKPLLIHNKDARIIVDDSVIVSCRF